jgi:hypothetical protein
MPTMALTPPGTECHEKHGEEENTGPLPLYRPFSLDVERKRHKIPHRRTMAFLGLLALFLWASSSCSLSNSAQNPPPPVPETSRNPAYLIKAYNGAVASENRICSDLGVRVLKEGGNAVDSAIATTFCVGVVNMFS